MNYPTIAMDACEGRCGLAPAAAGELLDAGGGATYVCPACWSYSGSYWSVYYHGVVGGCAYRNLPWFKKGMDFGIWLIRLGLLKR